MCLLALWNCCFKLQIVVLPFSISSKSPSVPQVFFPYSVFSHTWISWEIKGESTFAKQVSSLALGEDMALESLSSLSWHCGMTKYLWIGPNIWHITKKVLLDPLGEQPHSFPVAKWILFLREELTVHSFELNSVLRMPFSSTRKDLLLFIIKPLPTYAFPHGSGKLCIDFVSGSCRRQCMVLGHTSQRAWPHPSAIAWALSGWKPLWFQYGGDARKLSKAFWTVIHFLPCTHKFCVFNPAACGKSIFCS